MLGQRENAVAGRFARSSLWSIWKSNTAQAALGGLQRQGANRGIKRVAEKTHAEESFGFEKRVGTISKPAHSRSVNTSSASDICGV